MLLLRNKTASWFLCKIVVIKIHSKASENHSRFEVKRIKSGSLKRGVLNICSLINMPKKNEKYISNEEKARIPARRQEKMPIKVICERSGRRKAIIMRLLAAAKELPNKAVFKHKFGGGRRKKTSRLTDTIIKPELQKSLRFTALELQNLYPELLQQVKIRAVQHRLQKDLNLSSCKAAKKPLINKREKNTILPLRRNMHIGQLSSGGK